MSVLSIGDMSQHFQSLRQTAQIKTRLQTLNQELSTGQTADLTARMRGDTSALNAIDRELALLDSFGSVTQEVDRILSRAQLQLGAVDALRNSLTGELVQITADSAAPDIDRAASRARDDFDKIVNLVNSREGDRALFAGRTVDTTPLADAEAMLLDMQVAIGGATDAASIIAAIDTWFDDPAGGFATMGYLGDSGAQIERRISADTVLTLDARADDPGIKEVLKGTAKAAIVDLLVGTLTAKEQATLIRDGADTLFSAATPFVQLQASIGSNQEQVVLVQTAHAAQRTSFTLTRNDMTLADPFETATLLEGMQRQLELQFTTTARMSRLSLVNFI